MNQPKNKCPFANLFGKPMEGVHSWRVFGFAGADFLLTMAAAYIISAQRNKSFSLVFSQLMILAIILHRMFGVDTALNEIIFRDKMKGVINDNNDEQKK